MVPTLPGSARVFVLGLVLAASSLPAVGCTGKAPDKDAPLGCTKDTDCKGDRVCAAGTCQDAPADAKPGAVKGDAPAQPPTGPQKPATIPPPAVTPPPSSGSEFRAVPEAEWKPVLGPRLRIGAVVAHQVFEGPFGPSPKSMFVVTREGSDFYATVWADGHGYRHGPLANNGGSASKIPAVSFFDADGDGAQDALVMATYTPAGGGQDGYENVLLRWKGVSVFRLLALETGIARLESVAAIRAKLKR